MDKTKLVYTPPIQLVFIDPNTGEPCDGEVLFYVNGTNTPKNAYIATNDPSNPFQAVTKLKLNGAGSPDAVLFLYPYEESDPLINQTYKIVATNKNGVGVVTVNDFPPTASGGDKPTENGNVDNLLPSYGFDSQIFKNHYTAKDGNKNSLPNGKNPISQGLIWERQGTDNRLAQYDFEPILNSNIDGSPKNALILSVTNATFNDTLSRLYWRIGDYQSFQGKRLLLGIHAVNLEGTEKTLNVHYFRQKQGVDTNEIGSGTIAINSTIEQQSKTSFVVQPLTDQGYLNSDGLFAAIDLPLANFKLKLTATMLQETESNDLVVTEQNTGKNKASAVYALEDITEKEDFSENYAALPMMLTGNGISVNQIESRIEILPKGKIFNSYYEIGSQSIELISNKKNGDTKTNRLIKALRESNKTKSPYTFMCTSSADDKLTISTGLAIQQKNDWVISAGNRIEFDNESDGKDNSFAMGVIATHSISNGFNRLKLQWKENGTVVSRIFNPPVGGGSHFFDGGDAEDGGLNPVVANYFGFLNLTSSTSGAQLIHHFGDITYDAGTSSTKATYEFNFISTLSDSILLNGKSVSDRGDDFTNYWRPFQQKTVDYWLSNREVTNLGDISRYSMGYMQWNNPNNNPDPTGLDYILAYNISGVPPKNLPNANVKLKIININKTDSSEELVKKTLLGINNPTSHSFKYNVRPNTGDKYKFDNGKTEFSFVYVVNGEQKPVISDGSEVFYIPINKNDDVKTAKNAAIKVIENAVMGIPSQQELNLPNLEGYGYYMKA